MLNRVDTAPSAAIPIWCRWFGHLYRLHSYYSNEILDFPLFYNDFSRCCCCQQSSVRLLFFLSLKNWFTKHEDVSGVWICQQMAISNRLRWPHWIDAAPKSAVLNLKYNSQHIYTHNRVQWINTNFFRPKQILNAEISSLRCVRNRTILIEKVEKMYSNKIELNWY